MPTPPAPHRPSIAPGFSAVLRFALVFCTAATVAAENTPLHLAALRHDVAAVRSLLAAGADAKAQNDAGATPLLYGAGHPEIVRMLLEHGADPNTASKAKNTPLMAAVSHPDSFAAVQLLIAAGADPRAAKSPGREIMLPRAIVAGDARTIALLIEKGAPVDPSTGRAPIQDAIRAGNAELVHDFLARGVNLNFDTGFAGHAFNTALYNQQPAFAKLLIPRGTKLTFPSTLGPRTPPMVWSAYNNDGDDSVARALVAAGADVNAADAEGATALTYALRVGPDTPLVRYLQSVGATAPPPRNKPIPHRSVEATDAARAAAIRARLPATLALFNRSSAAFLENKFVRSQKCSTCHQQDLPALALDLGRRRGLAVDDHELGRMLDARVKMWTDAATNALEMSTPLPDFNVSLGYGLFGLNALGYQRDAMTDALMHYLLRTQRADGTWLVSDYRPPMEDGLVVAVGWSAFALRHYAPPDRAAEVAAAKTRLAGWLRAQPIRTQNDAVFKLLGLAWAGAKPADLRQETKALLDQQRADGGWAQLPGRPTDAWATGLALYALHEAGVRAPSDAAYLRGVDFLLRTQFDDGSWWVPSRSWPFQPHFDGKFPHGKDQWISAAATSWAAIALLQILPANNAVARPTSADLLARYQRHVEATPKAETVAAAPVSAAAKFDYTRDVRPLLERSCAGCHGRDKPRAGFNVLTRTALLKGGASGEAAISPGDPNASVLLSYVTDKIEDLEMPPRDRRDDYPALSPKEVELLREWIAAGAPDAEAKRAEQ